MDNKVIKEQNYKILSCCIIYRTHIFFTFASKYDEMNKLLKLFAIITFFFVACETDFDVTGEWQDNTVIYGILDKKDSIHEFKITKTFLGNKSAFDMAEIPDSSYYEYDEIEVYLQELEYGNLLREIKLDTAYITNKDSGTFFYPKQLIYKNKEPFYLLDNMSYKVVVNKFNSNELTTAEIEVISDFGINRPYTYTGNINFNVTYLSHLDWHPAENAYQYEGKIRFYYSEEKNGKVTDHFVDWILERKLDSDPNSEIIFKPNQFFEEMANLIPQKEGVVRYLGHVNNPDKQIDFIVSAIDINYFTIMNLSADEDLYTAKPVYSNVENGVGLVAMRSQEKAASSFTLTSQSSNELFYGEKTRQLNFQERN